MLPFAIYKTEIRFREKLLSFHMSVPSCQSLVVIDALQKSQELKG